MPTWTSITRSAVRRLTWTAGVHWFGAGFQRLARADCATVGARDGEPGLRAELAGRVLLCASMDDDPVAFPTLSESELAELALLGTSRSVVAGEYLFREGDPTYDFFVIVSGAADIVV